MVRLTPKFSIGDKVRITKKRKHLIKDTFKGGRKRFSKFLKFNWPLRWHITSDYNEEEIKGSFYEQELKKTKQDIFRIEKIIQQQGNKSVAKRFGYHDSFNSGLTTKTWTNYRAKVQCSQLRGLTFTSFPDVRPLWHSSLIPRPWLNSQFSPRLYWTTVSQFI